MKGGWNSECSKVHENEMEMQSRNVEENPRGRENLAVIFCSIKSIFYDEKLLEFQKLFGTHSVNLNIEFMLLYFTYISQ
jgi:hypothetical protein